MLEPISADQFPASHHSLPVAGLTAETARRTRVRTLSLAELSFRRMRYFIDLVLEGEHSALQSDLLSRSLRAERIALGIDVPELDAVPLCSCRQPDGTISIPFIQFIVGQIAQCADAFFTSIESASQPRSDAAQTHRRALQTLLHEIDPGRTSPASPPRLTDVRLQPAILDRLCGAQGLLKTLQGQCEALLAVGPGDGLQG